jgi:hypothetical protein
VAHNDPEYSLYLKMAEKRIADLIFMPSVGCESFAKLAHNLAYPIVSNLSKQSGNCVRIKSVTVAEHGSNSATYRP